ACIGIFNETLNYTQAVNACKEKQSFLISLKNRDKLEILRNEVSTTYAATWIGLDDTDTEGNFIWIEDLTQLNDTLKVQIFNAGEPNNGRDKEHCVQYVSKHKLLNDDDCKELQPYVCEQTAV
ncbi:unnamed protein product, partial [Lymnaea stagnalis]